ncbi:MAG: shikimate kinase [Oscillospiraceae bacterium]
MSTVYLCGFMGCGKSHVGRQLASALGRKFVDLDRVIVEGEGMTIPEIFDKFGEPHFRALEAEYIRKLSDGYVVATGGGALINDDTAAFARKSGLTVYINASFDTCYERIKDDTNRPLVVNNTPEKLREIYDTRAEIYRRNSECMVNGNARDYIIVGEIAKLAAFYEKNGYIRKTE